MRLLTDGLFHGPYKFLEISFEFDMIDFQQMLDKGRAIAQAVSRWLPTAATRVRARVWQVGSVVDKVTLA
jgi:hypothetical protein